MPRNIGRRRSKTLHKLCLESVFHEKHVSELSFEQQAAKSDEQEPFWR